METQNNPLQLSVLYVDPLDFEGSVYKIPVVTNIRHSDHGQMMECAMLVRKAVEYAVKSLPSCYQILFEKIIYKTFSHACVLNVGNDWRNKNHRCIDSERITHAQECETTTLNYTFYCTSREGVDDVIVEAFTKHNLPIEIW